MFGEMRVFSEIPFYLALGICLGLLQQSNVTYPSVDARISRLVRTATVLSLTVFLVILLLQLLKHRPYAAGLAVSTALVGWAGGRWFVRALESQQSHSYRRPRLVRRNQRLRIRHWRPPKYHQVQRRIVDVELSPNCRSRASDQSYGGTTSLATDPFPGRSKLKLALYYLDNLPTLMERDEQYRNLFPDTTKYGWIYRIKPT